MRLCLLSLLLPACLPAQEIRVISDSRGWSYGTREVRRSEKLPPSANLIGTRANDLILDCGAGGWIAYTCAKPPCKVAACMRKIEGMAVERIDPDARNGADATPSLANLLASFFRREPKAPETLGVRSGGNPNDAVVALGGEGIDFAPALNRVLEGRYCFRLSALPSGRPTTFVLDWNRERTGSGRAGIAGARPGGFALEKSTNETCSFDPAAAPAWVVVAPEADFGRIDIQWKQYTPWFRQLDQAGTTPESAATVRRAVLASLADMVEKK